ncbi:hypothetical protein RAA17_20860 [Komagataeibacter rhaeticus]|nr:hypothetical protein [Komagataeibacter rhaeticus]
MLLCITLPAVLLLVLTVRLSAGPLDITPAVRLLMPIPVAHGLKHEDIIGGLSAGHVRMGWNALHEGLRAPLVIWVEDVAIRRRNGEMADTLRRGRITIDSPALAHGRVRILELSASHGRLRFARNREGKFGLDLGPDTPYPRSGRRNRRRWIWTGCARRSCPTRMSPLPTAGAGAPGGWARPMPG